MEKNTKLLAIFSIFIAGISTASAALIAPGMTNDFQDGLTHGWGNGARVQTKTPPVVVKEGDNYYLEVMSKGDNPDPGDPDPDHNKRMVVSNKTYDWTIPRWLNEEPLPGGKPFTSDWAGDYSNITKIEGRVKATTDEADVLFMQLSLSDFFLYDETGIGYKTNSFVEIPTNGEWVDFSFSIDPDDLHPSPWTIKQGDDARTLDELITNTTSIRLAVYKDVEDRNVVFKGTLGLDDLRTVGTVPLPGAVWLMISGLLSLGGLSSYKRRHNA